MDYDLVPQKMTIAAPVAGHYRNEAGSMSSLESWISTGSCSHREDILHGQQALSSAEDILSHHPLTILACGSPQISSLMNSRSDGLDVYPGYTTNTGGDRGHQRRDSAMSTESSFDDDDDGHDSSVPPPPPLPPSIPPMLLQPYLDSPRTAPPPPVISTDQQLAWLTGHSSATTTTRTGPEESKADHGGDGGGVDDELALLGQNLNRIKLYHSPEVSTHKHQGRGGCSSSDNTSQTSATTGGTTSLFQGAASATVKRLSLHRRVSHETLPKMEEIHSSSSGSGSEQQRPPLMKTASVPNQQQHPRQKRGAHHRRNTTQLAFS